KHAKRAGEEANGRREIGEMVTVGVEREGPVGGDLHLADAADHHRVELDVGALEEPWKHRKQEAKLRKVLAPDDVEEAVAELRRRRRIHPAAVGLAVARPDREA